MRQLFILILMLGGWVVQAERSVCEQAYRDAYLQLALTGETRYEEPAAIYSIYFDYINGLTEIKSEEDRRILELIKNKMQNGQLCTSEGHVLTRAQIIELINKEFSK